MTTYLIDIPATFASDHLDRELPTGRLVKQGAKSWTFDCTADELNEWLDDAQYYSDPAIASDMRRSDPDGYYKPLIRSARLTVERITQAIQDQANQYFNNQEG